MLTKNETYERRRAKHAKRKRETGCGLNPLIHSYSANKTGTRMRTYYDAMGHPVPYRTFPRVWWDSKGIHSDHRLPKVYAITTPYFDPLKVPQLSILYTPVDRPTYAMVHPEPMEPIIEECRGGRFIPRDDYGMAIYPPDDDELLDTLGEIPVLEKEVPGTVRVASPDVLIQLPDQSYSLIEIVAYLFPKKLLVEAQRILKPGGLVCLGMNH